MQYDILCIILAREGSKGVPGKNLKMLGGIPLLAHSIIHAKRCIPSYHIVVSSDSQEILNVAKYYGVKTRIRPSEFATDNASSESALIDAVENQEVTKDILFLQPTSPVRFKNTLNDFINYYREEDFDSCCTVTKFPDFFWFYERSNLVSSYTNRLRRQDMNESNFKYFENGSAYIMKREMLLERKCRLGGEIGVFPISELESMQIDTPEEFIVLEKIFNGTLKELIK